LVQSRFQITFCRSKLKVRGYELAEGALKRPVERGVTARIRAKWGSEKQRISVSRSTLVGDSRIGVFAAGPKAGDVTGVCRENSMNSGMD